MRQMALFVLMLSIIVSGCTGNAGRPGPGDGGPGHIQEPPNHGIPRSEAEALVSAYLQAKVEGRPEDAAGRLLPASRNLSASAGPAWTQYQLVQATEVDEGWLIDTREFRTEAAVPLSSVARSHYLVVRGDDGKLYVDLPAVRWEGEKGRPYKTVETVVQPDTEAMQRRLLVSETAAGVLAQMEPDLPRTFRPFGAAPDIQFGVGDNGWGALALSPDLQTVAFVTRGTHPLLGLVDRNGEVRGLDLWFEGGAGELAWSFDGRYLAATNASPRGIFVLHLWDLVAGQPVKVTGLPDGRDVSRLQWQQGTLHVRVGAEPWLVDPASGQAIAAP